MLLVNLLADASADGFTLKDYMNLGVIVIMLLGYMIGKIIPFWAYDKSEKAREKAEALVDQYRDKFEQEVLPQLYENTKILAEAISLMQRQNK
jgi:hypothetical protein